MARVAVGPGPWPQAPKRLSAIEMVIEMSKDMGGLPDFSEVRVLVDTSALVALAKHVRVLNLREAVARCSNSRRH